MSWAHFLLQANIYLVVFYAFYKLLLAKETYFKLNRLYLLTAAILAMLIPFLRVDWLNSYSDQSNNLMNGMVALNNLVTEVSVAVDRPNSFYIGRIIAMVYLSGLLFFSLKFLYQLIMVNNLLRTNRLFKTNCNGAAFSFFNQRVIDPTLPELQTIDYHEQVHSRQWHSLDVVIFEIMGILCWFNPIIYGYKKSIRNIHEYLADEEAAKYIGDKQQYALLLLSKSFGVPLNSLTNSFFNQSLLKNRINMLNQEKSPKKALLKYGLYLPVFGLTLLLSSATLRSNEQIEEFTASIPLEKSMELVESITLPQSQNRWKAFSQDTVYDFVTIDQQPTFQGGMDKFYEYLSKSVKYPKEAVAKNIQGKVFLSFIVEKDGALSNINVDRKLGAGTDEEAVRVLAESPKWIPGKIAGKPVRVKYNIPINFALSKKTTDSVPNKVVAINAESVLSGKKPLIYVDGIKSNEESIKAINSDNIASVHVYKSDKAVERYGEEGREGVVEITTRTKAGKATEKATEKTGENSGFIRSDNN
jgi:TonB family protein